MVQVERVAEFLPTLKKDVESLAEETEGSVRSLPSYATLT